MLCSVQILSMLYSAQILSTGQLLITGQLFRPLRTRQWYPPHALVRCSGTLCSVQILSTGQLLITGQTRSTGQAPTTRQSFSRTGGQLNLTTGQPSLTTVYPPLTTCHTSLTTRRLRMFDPGAWVKPPRNLPLCRTLRRSSASWSSGACSLEQQHPLLTRHRSVASSPVIDLIRICYTARGCNTTHEPVSSAAGAFG
jgi:hypothetical protein